MSGLLRLRCRRQAPQGPWTTRRRRRISTTIWPLLSTRSRIETWTISLCLDQACRDRGVGFSGRHDRLELSNDFFGVYRFAAAPCVFDREILLLLYSPALGPDCYIQRRCWPLVNFALSKCHCLHCCQRLRRHSRTKRQQALLGSSIDPGTCAVHSHEQLARPGLHGLQRPG